MSECGWVLIIVALAVSFPVQVWRIVKFNRAVAKAMETISLKQVHRCFHCFDVLELEVEGQAVSVIYSYRPNRKTGYDIVTIMKIADEYVKKWWKNPVTAAAMEWIPKQHFDWEETKIIGTH